MAYDEIPYLQAIAAALLPAEVTTSVKISSSEVYGGPCKVYWASFYTKAQSPAEGDLRDGGAGSTQRFRFGVVGYQYANYNHKHALFNPPVQYNTNLYVTLPNNTVITIGYVAD